uniref:Secreted protein n=1 Tax=Anopheles darlingi TaxID=43151 RepID=A0A2M4D668_ANODA
MYMCVVTVLVPCSILLGVTVGFVGPTVCSSGCCGIVLAGGIGTLTTGCFRVFHSLVWRVWQAKGGPRLLGW